ncbi:hypothetical protein [Nocardioides convexus]|uniref:hypothetical protein n=1 Tax=Nocardioides convexus TaxID=2712224 RepID=UPI002418459C|nr:hypothetical protein [Nocardioides convexus]
MPSSRSLVRAPRRWIGLALSLVVLLAVWSLVAGADLVEPHYLTPSPREVWDAFVRANSLPPDRWRGGPGSPR